MQTRLELLNVHATILFEGIRPWNDVKPGLGIYLERHCKASSFPGLLYEEVMSFFPAI